MSFPNLSANQEDLLINYVYSMVVSENKDIKMIITSEITSKKLMALSDDNMKEQLKKPFLCVFN
jgi:hypothetical protein